MRSDQSDDRKATGRDIILTIGKAMIDGLEPLVTRVLAPNLYQVYLHPDDYARLRHVFPKLEEDARAYLDRELDRLNHLSQSIPERVRQSFGPDIPESVTFLDRLTNWIRRTKKVFGIGLKSSESAIKVERPQGNWHIQFQEDPNGTLQPGDVEVVADLAVGEEGRYGSGSKTHRITSVTRRLGKTESRHEVRSAPAPTTAKNPSQPRAWFRFTDDSGAQTYAMEKDEIVIGRKAEDTWVDLHVETSAPVSREHARVRYRNGGFQIKDLSTNGTTVNGHSLRSSLVVEGGWERDIEIWEVLPDGATIELASAVTLKFETART